MKNIVSQIEMTTMKLIREKARLATKNAANNLTGNTKIGTINNE
ncbi:hypothetical protein [Domibacillus sp. A3M-37]|nr:hypothetical protein [Domibacillus sp. A3M-37]